MSQITTHILDTSIGKPAPGVPVILEQKVSDDWKKIAEGLTNEDGRLDNLLAKDKILETAIYRLIFETTSYFTNQNKKSFYPRITIEFEIFDASHYHVPLLLNPFGYSTYRGS
ncbi:MAG TPA: hydroxyisourate hydrolase [Bacteroidia bacterium]|nr:hydroxyisourate hydrolase [Bacteroidia bacterium]